MRVIVLDMFTIFFEKLFQIFFCQTQCAEHLTKCENVRQSKLMSHNGFKINVISLIFTITDA